MNRVEITDEGSTSNNKCDKYGVYVNGERTGKAIEFSGGGCHYYPQSGPKQSFDSLVLLMESLR